MLCFFFPFGSYSLNIDLQSDTTPVNNMAYWVSKGTLLFFTGSEFKKTTNHLVSLFTFNCGKHYAFKFFANPFL